MKIIPKIHVFSEGELVKLGFTFYRWSNTLAIDISHWTVEFDWGKNI